MEEKKHIIKTYSAYKNKVLELANICKHRAIPYGIIFKSPNSRTAMFYSSTTVPGDRTIIVRSTSVLVITTI